MIVHQYVKSEDASMTAGLTMRRQGQVAALQKSWNGKVRELGFENESPKHFLSKHLQVVSLIYFELKNLFELADSLF